MIRKTIKSYLVISFTYKFGISFIAATYATFLLSKGLNLFQVNLVNVVFFATMFLAEVPTGAIADIFGRRASVFLASCLHAVAMLVYANSQSFTGFAIAEATAAIGGTFFSGAFQAWLVDCLKENNYDGNIGQVFSWEHQLCSITGVVAAVIGAWLADFNPSWPWLAGSITCFIASLLILFLMKEDNMSRAIHASVFAGFSQMLKVSKTAIHYAVTEKPVRLVLYLGFFQMFAVQASNMQWQPLFLPHLGSKSALGFIWAGVAISMAIGASLVFRFLGLVRENEKMSLLIAQIMTGIFIIATVHFRIVPLALTAFLFHEFWRGLYRPLKDKYLNDNIPSAERATIISFQAILQHFGAVVGLLFSGYMATCWSIPWAWTLSGAILIASTLLLLKNGQK